MDSKAYKTFELQKVIWVEYSVVIGSFLLRTPTHAGASKDYLGEIQNASRDARLAHRKGVRGSRKDSPGGTRKRNR